MGVSKARQQVVGVFIAVAFYPADTAVFYVKCGRIYFLLQYVYQVTGDLECIHAVNLINTRHFQCWRIFWKEAGGDVFWLSLVTKEETFIKKSFMTRIKLYALLAGMLLPGVITYAQTVDEIISKNTVAMGGDAVLKGITSQYMEGNMEMQGQTVPLKRWVKQNEAMRLEFNIMGTNNVQVVTPTMGWSLMPIMQQTEPQEMDAQTMKVMKAQLDLRGELYDYKKKGKKIELMGKDTVNGSMAYKLKVNGEDGTNSIAYLDATSFLLVKATNKVNVQGQDMQKVTLLSHYKKTPEGNAYPGVTEQSPIGIKINIDKVEMNKPVADSLFTKPH
jgi:hypothetical protein